MFLGWINKINDFVPIKVYVYQTKYTAVYTQLCLPPIPVLFLNKITNFSWLEPFLLPGIDKFEPKYY